jgi:hypothetical protein
MSAKHLLLGITLTFMLSACISRRDAMAPMITIVEPASGSARSVDNLFVRGYAMDDEGVSAIRVGDTDLLSADVFKSQKGKKLVYFGFQPSNVGETFSTNIVAEDTTGRTTTLPYELIIDTSKPSIEISSVTAMEDGRLRVVGIARDNDKVKRIVIAGQELSFIPQAERQFAQEVDVSETMTIDVTDSAGNTESVPIQ